MPARITSSHLLASSSLGGPVRVSASFALVFAGRERINLVTASQIHVTYGGLGPQRVTYTRVMVFHATTRAILPEFIESGQVFEPYEVELIVPDINPPEVNPYRPTVPEEYYDLNPTLYDFQREMQEVLRLQHNVTQMGDTTYHWAYLVKPSTEQLYNLGSLGRFYHEEYGLILARYVRFKRIRETQYTIAPCGFLKDNKNSASFAWEVTNDIELSDPHLALGIMTPYQLPKEGEYGWVIIAGTNLGSIKYSGTENPAQNTPLIWGEGFSLTNQGSGRILARVWDSALKPEESLGSLILMTEGFSDAYYEGLFTDTFEELQSDLEELESKIGALELLTGTTGFAATINSIQITLTGLQNQLNSEKSARTAADQRIRDDFASILNNSWEIQLAALETELRSLITSVQNGLNVKITNLTGRVSSLESSITSAGLSTLATDLNSINASIVSILKRLGVIEKTARILPVVLGTNPAEFLVDDDGNLIYTEIG